MADATTHPLPAAARALRRPSATQLAWGAALLLAVVPLWSSQALPLVDLPQHLHLISVLHRLDDASTLYPSVFARRPELTPYLGYYYTVSALHWLMPIEAANRVFLSAYVVGLPDPRREEILVAVVVLKPDQQVEPGGLLGLCRDALAAYKVPQQIHLMKREDLPLTGTGKVQKFRLAEQLAAAREAGAS